MAKAKSKTKTNDASNSNTRNASGNSSSKAKFSSDYFNPSQFFNNANYANFQPANAQQWMEQFLATSQKNFEVVTACTQLAVERCKDLLEEQANFTSKMMQETASTFQETLTNSNDTKDKMEEIAEYAKYCMEKAATAARKAAEENIQIAQEISDTLSKRCTESVEELRSASAA